jgi:aminoglycoside/choline kinase family phosphotransferase
MVKNNKVYFIDFQGARSGPLQYDLASLLIDPYVNLKNKIRDELLQYAMEKLQINLDERENFLQCYHYCSLTRNMQFLGAFSFLSQTKKKKKFEQYIPDSIQSLKQIITDLNMDNKIPKLSKLTLSI